MQKYLTKYLTKNEEKQNNQSTESEQQTDKENKPQTEKIQQTGRIWGCSQNLSGIKGFTSEIDTEISEELTELKRSKHVRIYEADYFTVINVSFKNLRKYGAEHLFLYFANYLIEQFDFHLQLET